MILHRMGPKLRLKHHRRLARRAQLQLSLDQMLKNEGGLKTYSQSLPEETGIVKPDELARTFEHGLEPFVTRSALIFSLTPFKTNLQLLAGNLMTQTDNRHSD